MNKWIMIAISIVLLLNAQIAHAESVPDFNKLANAIHIAENGHRLDKGEQYGIHSVHYSTEAEARQICLRTLKHKYAKWRALKWPKTAYLEYLSTKYCPVNHKVWFRNVEYFYAKA